jgi:hypothetical protein
VTSRNIYIGLGVVFLASIVAVIFLHYFTVNAFAEIAALPVIGSLVGALFQLSRDSVAHQRVLALEDASNRFTVGATSHMADVAFDKHVEFCEKYCAKMEEALTCLRKNGPTAKVLPLATELFQIRRAAALWLTPELEEELEPYETMLLRIGVHEQIVTSNPDWDDRHKYIQEMFMMYSEIVGDKTDTKGNPTKGDVATDKIIASLRMVLGIGELTRLRSDLIIRASETIELKKIGEPR